MFLPDGMCLSINVFYTWLISIFRFEKCQIVVPPLTIAGFYPTCRQNLTSGRDGFYRRHGPVAPFLSKASNGLDQHHETHSARWRRTLQPDIVSGLWKESKMAQHGVMSAWPSFTGCLCLVSHYITSPCLEAAEFLIIR